MTKVVLMRHDGKGVRGTILLARHHAQQMLPFIRAMKDVVGELGFAVWKQGHRIHEFVTEDGRRYTLRAIVRHEDENRETPYYIGVRLARRVSRSEEDHLYDIDSVEEVPSMLSMMRNLAKPKLGRDSRLMKTSCNE